MLALLSSARGFGPSVGRMAILHPGAVSSFRWEEGPAGRGAAGTPSVL